VVWPQTWLIGAGQSARSEGKQSLTLSLGSILVTSYLRLMIVFWASCWFAVAARADIVSGPSLLFDARTGEVFSQDRAGEPWYPASLTKLMTGYVIFKKIKEGKLRLDQDIPVSDLAHSQPASRLGLPVGTMVSVDFALQAMLVYSANDMAYVLAEAGGGTIDGFARDMNAVAKELGLNATHFVNPNGLFDPRQITSARDIGIIAALLINQFPEHAHYFKQEYVVVGKRRLSNHNSLIRLMPEAVGMKTGFICSSGYNLVGSAIKDGRQLVSVVLGARNGGQRAALSKKLLDLGFSKQPEPSQGKVAEIVDQSYGAIVPADMGAAVCKGRPPQSLVSAHDISGWAVSFGTYDSLVKADMALRGRMIAPAGIDVAGQHGVVKMPGGAGYAALMWSLDQPRSLTLCQQYKLDGAPCDVLPDELVTQIAASVPAEPALVQAGTDEGSDTERPPPPHPKRVVRRGVHKKR
jgi:D-alanyl-D-alanine carboxypeptidase